jgi:pilus assembly protein Flp/PilA
MKALVRNFWNDESGATAIEYGLIAAGIALAIIAAVKNVGVSLNGVFDSVDKGLKAAPAAG